MIASPARRLAAGLLGLFALACLASPAPAAPVIVTDIAGRTVTLKAPAKRIVLAEGRQLVALALLDRNPVCASRRLVGGPAPPRSRHLRSGAEHLPKVDDVPLVGRDRRRASPWRRLSAWRRIW